MKTKFLSVAAALALFASANSAVQAETIAYTYSLNGTLAEDSGSGPSLVAYGGTLTSSGYYFGPNTGLSLSNAINPYAYSIDIHFYFDSLNASFNGYQRILDFYNRTSDEGLYSYYGALSCFSCGGQQSDITFTAGQFADLRVTRSASGLFNAYINGALAFSALTSDGSETFSGPMNIIYFFIDDLVSLGTHPTQLEAGSGLINFIEVTSDRSAVPGPIAGSGLPGLIAASGGMLAWWRRKRKAQAVA